jgi:hypothetical protein
MVAEREWNDFLAANRTYNNISAPNPRYKIANRRLLQTDSVQERIDCKHAEKEDKDWDGLMGATIGDELKRALPTVVFQLVFQYVSPDYCPLHMTVYDRMDPIHVRIAHAYGSPSQNSVLCVGTSVAAIISCGTRRHFTIFAPRHQLSHAKTMQW